MSSTKLRVLIVDDHRMVAESLVRLLDDEPDIEVVGIARDRLVVSRNTVRTHVQKVLAKLGAHSKLKAVAIATRAGLLDGA